MVSDPDIGAAVWISRDAKTFSEKGTKESLNW